ncbi:selenoprotein M [Anabrus simplex]|uniref:selenoprotein M n=1 Tax=Anabrus simplex TaxID=316456 RepID=UPI0034DCCAC2
MAPVKFLVLVLPVILSLCSSNASVEDKTVTTARIESCKGCRLNRLPDVKKFIFEDVPLFKDVTFKPIPGASPELILLNKFDQELERIDLAPLSRKDCNALLIDRGFQRKEGQETAHHDDF